MIKQIAHPATDTGPATLTLALAIATELHTPAPRAPEVAPASRHTTRRTKARRRTTVRG